MGKKPAPAEKNYLVITMYQGNSACDIGEEEVFMTSSSNEVAEHLQKEMEGWDDCPRTPEEAWEKAGETFLVLVVTPSSTRPITLGSVVGMTGTGWKFAGN